MNKLLKKICDNLAYSIYEGDNYYEISFYSPLGEDFCFAIDKDNWLEDLENYVYDFDAEEHAAMWYENKDTVKGVPQSLKYLLSDAEEIKKMLEELLNEVDNMRAEIETEVKIQADVLKFIQLKNIKELLDDEEFVKVSDMFSKLIEENMYKYVEMRDKGYLKNIVKDNIKEKYNELSFTEEDISEIVEDAYDRIEDYKNDCVNYNEVINDCIDCLLTNKENN